jgi:hypothetical protein
MMKDVFLFFVMIGFLKGGACSADFNVYLPLCHEYSSDFILPCFAQTNGLCETGRMGNLIFALMGISLYSQKHCLRPVVPQVGFLKKMFSLSGLTVKEDESLFDPIKMKKLNTFFEWDQVPPERLVQSIPATKRKFEYVRDVIQWELFERSLIMQPFLKNRSYFSFFFYPTNFYSQYLSLFKKMFTFHKDLQDYLAQIREVLLKQENLNSLIFMHLRRGDLLEAQERLDYYFLAPTRWYQNWIDDYRQNVLKDPQKPLNVFLASDGLDQVLSSVQEIPYLNVLTRRDLMDKVPFLPRGYTRDELELIVDWGMLAYRDFAPRPSPIYLLSNSTFSVSSAFFASDGEFFRPDSAQKKLVRFDPHQTEILWPGHEKSFFD